MTPPYSASAKRKLAALKKMGVTRVTPDNINKAFVEAIQRQLDKGKSAREIGLLTGYTAWAINHIIREFALQRRAPATPPDIFSDNRGAKDKNTADYDTRQNYCTRVVDYDQVQCATYPHTCGLGCLKRDDQGAPCCFILPDQRRGTFGHQTAIDHGTAVTIGIRRR